MRLGFYIGKTFVASVALSLILLVILVVSVTFIESAGHMSDLDNGAWVALQLALFQAVDFAYQLLPITGFLGALITGALLARNGEFLAMQAAGLGPTKILLPCLLVILMLCALGGMAAEWAVPWGLQEAEKIRVHHMQRPSALTRFYNRRNQWFRHNNLVLYLPSVDLKTGVFHKPVIYDMVDGNVREVIEAETMQEIDGDWVLKSLSIHRSGGVPFEERDEKKLQLQLSTRDLTDVTGNPRHLRTSELDELVERRLHAGYNSAMHALEVHQRIAFPMLALWLFLLAAPWVIDPRRRRSLTLNLGVGVLAIAVVLSLTQVFRLLALGGKINAGFGAWGVAFVCLLALPVSWIAQRRIRIRGSLF